MMCIVSKWLICLLLVYDITMEAKVTRQSYDIVKKIKTDASPVHDCPLLCRCPTPDWVDCSGAELEVVPLNISNATLTLQLDKNRLSTLPSECFSDCPRVRTLDLHGNMLSEEGFSPSAFTPFRELRDLLLSDNRLEVVPGGLPDTLVTLHLAGNNIKKIDPDVLALKGQLRHLYLHDNQLTSSGIDRKSFHGLRQLKEVTLANNLISAFPPVPPAAEVVYLQNNNIYSIPDGSFRRRRNVRVLFLQNNKLSDDGIGGKSFAGLSSLEYLDLSGNLLTTVPGRLPLKLTRLHLERNRITNITGGPLERLRRLEYLLLHQNGLESSGIEPGAFPRLHRLVTLHIFDNKLSRLPALPRRIENLVILRNRIRRISLVDFKKQSRMKHLDLRHNQLTNRRMARGALRRMTSLTTIDFTGNKLRAVPVLPRNVETLILTANHVKRIPPGSLARVPRLRHLAVGSNKLSNVGIPLTVFRNSGKLRVLDLNDNFLTSVPKRLPESLEYLYMERNMIAGIERGDFDSARKLKGIFLQENRLLPETVSKAAFAPLRHLQRIDVTWSRRSDATKTSRRRRHVETQSNGWKDDACGLKREENHRRKSVMTATSQRGPY